MADLAEDVDVGVGRGRINATIVFTRKVRAVNGRRAELQRAIATPRLTDDRPGGGD